MSSKFKIPKTFLVSEEQARWIDNQSRMFNFSEAMRQALNDLMQKDS